jgi:hypothetical protein
MREIPESVNDDTMMIMLKYLFDQKHQIPHISALKLQFKKQNVDEIETSCKFVQSVLDLLPEQKDLVVFFDLVYYIAANPSTEMTFRDAIYWGQHLAISILQPDDEIFISSLLEEINESRFNDKIIEEGTNINSCQQRTYRFLKDTKGKTCVWDNGSFLSYLNIFISHWMLLWQLP